jgi:hypothetical protein
MGCAGHWRLNDGGRCCYTHSVPMSRDLYGGGGGDWVNMIGETVGMCNGECKV